MALHTVRHLTEGRFVLTQAQVRPVFYTFVGRTALVPRFEHLHLGEDFFAEVG
jgi:hypothetical protein